MTIAPLPPSRPPPESDPGVQLEPTLREVRDCYVEIGRVHWWVKLPLAIVIVGVSLGVVVLIVMELSKL